MTQRIGNGIRRFSASAAKQRSWVEYDEASNFPVQNIPFGVFSSAANGPRCATAIGNNAVDLCVLADAGLLSDLPFSASAAFRQPTLNAFMGLDRKAWVATRARLQELLAVDGDDRRVRAVDSLLAGQLGGSDVQEYHAHAAHERWGREIGRAHV